MFGFEAKDYVIGGVAVAGLATGIVSHCRTNKTNKRVNSLENDIKVLDKTCTDTLSWLKDYAAKNAKEAEDSAE